MELAAVLEVLPEHLGHESVLVVPVAPAELAEPLVSGPVALTGLSDSMVAPVAVVVMSVVQLVKRTRTG